MAALLHGCDSCIICKVHHAHVKLSGCTHRNMCEQCFVAITNFNSPTNNPLKCPQCRKIFTPSECSIVLQQLEPVTIALAPQLPSIDGDRYAFGYRLLSGTPGETTVMATDDMIRAVRELFENELKGTLTHTQLTIILNERLTPAQAQLAYAELVKDEDLHPIVVRYMDAIQMRNVPDCSRDLVKKLIEGDDLYAIGMRAGATVAVDGAATVFTGMTALSLGDGITNLAVGAIFVSIDVYRWSKGELTDAQLGWRVTEHAAGCSAAFGGAVAGAIAGAMVGGPFALVTSFIFMILGGVVADFMARCGVRYVANSFYEFDAAEKERLYRSVVKDSASLLNIDIDAHSKTEAHSRFRRQMLSCHPDKFVTASAEVKEEKKALLEKTIGAWQVVRDWYERHPCDEADAAEFNEVVINVYTMKVRESADKAWNYVRTFWETTGNAHPDDNSELQHVERVAIYA